MHRRFAAFAWAALGYTVLVILWGAFVRATGSGAGCGDHWPLCNGEVIPRSPTMETFVEYFHRITSGLALLAVLGLYVWARRLFPKGSLARRGAGLSLFFMVVESLIGAGLVLFEHVAYNVSIARAYWMSAHLVNTFFLVAVMTLTAYWASGGGAFRFRGGGALAASIGATLVGMTVLGASGGVAALGDTLVIGGGISPMENEIVKLLVGLRIYHPLIACGVLLLLGWAVYVAFQRPTDGRTRVFAATVMGLYLLQMGIGLVNVALMAPVWIQILHLFVTNLIWIGTVLFTATALAVPSTAPAPVRARAAVAVA